MKVKCPVIEDLLPLYIDDICSEESKIIIKEHLKECKACSNKYIIQNSHIKVDNKAIKENLKSKEPFKKIKRYNLLKLITFLAAIPLVYLLVIELGGNGVGASALHGRYKANKFLTYIEMEEFTEASRYVGFSGGIYEDLESREIAKEKWVEGMQRLESSGIDFVSHKSNNIKTNDRFTSGDIIISIKYEGQVYEFRLFVSTNTGKVETGGLSLENQYEFREPTAAEMLLINEISEVISTYNPG